MSIIETIEKQQNMLLSMLRDQKKVVSLDSGIYLVKKELLN
jgi:hypothetical protein